MTNDLGINGDRLFQSLMEMERISALPAGGCERLALTDDDQIARWAEEAGCSVTPDRLGDMFARRPDRNSDPPPIAIGSSLGTQPSGDRIDGFHGVLAGLNVVRSLNDHGSKTDSPLEIATQALGYPHRHMVSNAEHDPCMVARKVPMAMMFVSCKDGLSQNEAEWAEPEHQMTGCNVLFQASLALSHQSALAPGPAV